jgi:CheY-like chemotaxis protein
VSGRILIVEDEPALVLTLSDRLRAEGYEVESAETGDLGVRRAREGSFDLVLLDVMLPGKNGFDVLRDLRQQRVATPVVMLTARGQVLDRVLGLKLGADDYLPKPFDMMELVARVEAVLRRRGAAPDGAGSYSFGDVRVDFRRAHDPFGFERGLGDDRAGFRSMKTRRWIRAAERERFVLERRSACSRRTAGATSSRRLVEPPISMDPEVR